MPGRSSTAGSPRAPRRLTYADAGVSLDAKDRFTDSIESILRRTYGPRVIANPGGFAGMLRLDYNERLFARNFKEPVLVACADGVGTKLKLAAALRVYSTIGIDLVAMNVNDLIVQGAEPLLFLDYIAVPKVEPAMLRALLEGMGEGCRRAGCALLGGETAEMPDVYAPGDFDLAGFCVGVVELKRAVRPSLVRPGDVVLGLGSDGIHSNGFTLVRRIVEQAGLDLERVYPDALEPGAPAVPLGRLLLTPTRIYVRPIVRLRRAYAVKKVITGMAHITGSGLAGNLCRALNPRVDAVVDPAAWQVPALFRFLQKHGGIDEDEMRRVFNMGIGYTLIVRPAFAAAVRSRLRRMGERVFVIGEIAKGRGDVRYK